MEYVYAAMLLHSANKEITESALEAVVKASGLEVDKAKVKSLVEALKDVDIEQAIKDASVAPVAVAAVSSAPATEAKKEEKKEEGKSEEDAAAGLGSLFG